MLYEMMKKSYDILVSHPINVKGGENGPLIRQFTVVLGAGTRPALTSFEKKPEKRCRDFGSRLAQGYCSWRTDGKYERGVGANGGLHTNYRGSFGGCARPA